jgi:hypothetical protein
MYFFEANKALVVNKEFLNTEPLATMFTKYKIIFKNKLLTGNNEEGVVPRIRFTKFLRVIFIDEVKLTKVGTFCTELCSLFVKKIKEIFKNLIKLKNKKSIFEYFSK